VADGNSCWQTELSAQNCQQQHAAKRQQQQTTGREQARQPRACTMNELVAGLVQRMDLVNVQARPAASLPKAGLVVQAPSREHASVAGQ
jgi:hypothetical protein